MARITRAWQAEDVPDRGEPERWLLTAGERGNPRTRVDDLHPGAVAWSTGNLVRPLVHGATYFAELVERIEATGPGDLVLFTDWQGDADQRLTDDPDSTVLEVLGRADERGVDVRGLVWRSHSDVTGFTARQNANLGRALQRRGAEAILDMRVRVGGSHHQKLVVVRHGDDPSRDIAFVGGIDLAHSRRDTRGHPGDPQPVPGMPEEYGARPPWHDVQAAVTGPAVHDVETTFRERWEDPTSLRHSPIILLRDRLRGLDTTPDPLPPQAPPPPPVPGGTHAVQLLRTYPDLRGGRDYAFAHGGERSVARGYTKALEQARRLVYVEDQYLWGDHVGRVFAEALTAHPDLHVVVIVPLHPDVTGLNRLAQREGRRRAMEPMHRVAPDRVAVYGLENDEGTPIYVHAKTCVIDDTWTTIGSDNFNRRSWTHDSELSVVVVDEAGDYARRLRLALAAEHLGRGADDPMEDCMDPAAMFAVLARAAADLDAWHAGGRVGPRPPGRLRRLRPPRLGRAARALASAPYLLLHDPDGRPRELRRRGEY
ncbi:phosphatidylserine/phosphatidylglycerophosphate/cardiolipin synthase-like enzyme [Nocardioides zeae]|uniref:Phosphatidylserine/phosphatidylglycerophosphate/ cardiolipin synthase-like enzyme n=1 Tax=Nocardioides zeae TaxID=1457234 RepID=A0AAJ1X273_9ACTN|nr:phosphatidylserine/phosphatidylglycerophosphate/cardiolipin synthase-like enzyme [Nocardioides zeae]